MTSTKDMKNTLWGEGVKNKLYESEKRNEESIVGERRGNQKQLYVYKIVGGGMYRENKNKLWV